MKKKVPGSKLQLSLFDSAINNDPTINYSKYDNLLGSERNERRDSEKFTCT